MDFSQVKQLFIPQGEVTKITNLEGITLWQKISRILKEWRGLSPLTCTPTVADNFEEVKVYGQSVQNPIKSRNLLDKDNLINGYYSTTGVLTSPTQDTYKTYDKFPVKPNTNYILSSNSPALAIYWRMCFWDKDKNFISRNANPIYTQIKFNTGDNIAYVSISPEKEGWEYDLQLEEGDTATPFVPYIIDTPTPDTPIPVESVGDRTINLFDKVNAPVGGYLGANGEFQSGTNTKHIKFLKIPQDVTYISRYTDNWVSSSMDYSTRVGFYDENYSMVKVETIFGSGINNKVAVPTGAKYIQCSIATKDIEGTVIYWGNKDITDYVPYGYQIPVEVSGKNLFDGEIELGGLDVVTGLEVTNSARTRSSNFISVKPNTTYTFTRTDGTNKWVLGYDENKNIVTDGTEYASQGRYGALFQSGTVFIFEFKTTPTTKYIRWYDTDCTNITETIQIEEGSTATSYQPYVTPTTTNIYLNEPLRKVGEHTDTMSIKGNEVTVVRNVGSVLLDNLTLADYETAYARYKFSGIENAIKYSTNRVGDAMSEIGTIWNTGGGATDVTDNHFYWINSSTLIYFVTRTITDTETFRNLITGKHLYYPLATQTTETYAINSPINAIDNTTIIDIDTIIKPSEVYASQWIEQ